MSFGGPHLLDISGLESDAPSTPYEKPVQYILSLAIGKTVYRRCQVQGQRGTEGFGFKWAMINKLVDRRTDHDDRSRHKTVQPLRDVPQQSDTIIRRRYGKLAIYE